jgi:anthranilate phosphoribosyltransferase
MKHVGPTRVELGTRTIFNLLGPLSNPANASRQLIGVYHRQWVRPVAEVLAQLGSERAWVVHGSDGLDEITTTGATYVAELKGGRVTTFDILPEDVGFKRAAPQDLKGGDPEFNAKAIRDLLDGKPGPYRDVVVLNAGAALLVAGKAQSLKDGIALAAAIVDSRAARGALEGLVAISNSKPVFAA